MLIRDALDLFYEICTNNIKDCVNKELENNENRFQKIFNSEEMTEDLRKLINKTFKSTGKAEGFHESLLIIEYCYYLILNEYLLLTDEEQASFKSLQEYINKISKEE